MKYFFLYIICFINYTSFSQNYNWFPISSSVNSPVRKLIEYDGKLIVAGDFTMADDIPVASIAAWDGTNWTALGDGIINTNIGNYGIIYDMIVHHDSLFVVGNFHLAGGLPANNIAVWDGNNWSALLSGSNQNIYDIEVYQDTLYVTGSFDTIGTIYAKNIAKWTGSSWANLGDGIRTDSNNGFGADMEVYNNKLFVTGSIDSAGNIECNNVAYWDGYSWSTIPASSSFTICNDMIVWNFELLFDKGSFNSGSDLTTEVTAWDGTGFYTFSWEQMNSIYDFYIFNNELYCGGHDAPYDYGNDVRKWNGTNWESVGTGLSNVSTLCVYNNVLYAGGNFNTSWGHSGDYISRYAELNSISENEFENNFSLFPNPSSDIQHLTIKNLNNQDLSIAIVNPAGQIITQVFDGTISGDEMKLEIDLSELSTGIYLYQIQTEDKTEMIRFIKN